MIKNFTKKHRGFTPTPNLVSGFTLVELLVVVAVIGLLASLVLVSLGGGTTRAKDTRIITDLNLIRTAAEVIRTADGNYNNVIINADISALMVDMANQNATSIMRFSNNAGYCVEALMPGGKWGCVNSGLTIITNGAANMLCNGAANNGAPTSISCSQP